MEDRSVKILWTQSGCVRCEDFRNAGLYNQIPDLVEMSFEDAEGLSLAVFYEMFNKKADLETPALYLGSKWFGDEEAEKYIGEDVKVYLEGLQNSKTK